MRLPEADAPRASSFWTVTDQGAAFQDAAFQGAPRSCVGTQPAAPGHPAGAPADPCASTRADARQASCGPALVPPVRGASERLAGRTAVGLPAPSRPVLRRRESPIPPHAVGPHALTVLGAIRRLRRHGHRGQAAGFPAAPSGVAWVRAGRPTRSPAVLRPGVERSWMFPAPDGPEPARLGGPIRCARARGRPAARRTPGPPRVHTPLVPPRPVRPARSPTMPSVPPPGPHPRAVRPEPRSPPS